MQISEPAEYALLGLLEHQSMHGYEMFQQFEHGILGQIVHLEMSQMYAFLKKLERLEYIAAELESQGTRPPRKVFHLTAMGRSVFQHWLEEPVERPRDVRLLFLIKLYFTQHITPKQTIALIEKQIAACHDFLERLEVRFNPEGASDDLAFFDHVVLRSRIHQIHAIIDWLNELRHELATD